MRNIFVRGLDNTNPTLVAKPHPARVQRSHLAESASARASRSCTTWASSPRFRPRFRIPTAMKTARTSCFILDEASKYSFNIGFGAELARIGGGVTTFDAPAGTTAFSPRVSAGISRLNFLGLGHIVSLQTLVSTLEQRVGLTYQAPQFGGTRESVADLFRSLRRFAATSAPSPRTAWRVRCSWPRSCPARNTIQYRYTVRRVTIPQDSLKISPGAGSHPVAAGPRRDRLDVLHPGPP